MADKQTTLITNLNANPPTLMNPPLGGTVQKVWASLTTDTVHDAADVLRFFRVHSSLTYVAHRVATADIGGATSVLDVGLYLADSGAVLDDACFAAALAISAALDTGYVVTPAGAASAQTVETMFQLGGGTAANDDQWYDVAGTIDTLATDAAGLALIEMWYIDPAA